MENFLIYIGKSALAAGTFYLLYLALFQHQKHFMFNRIYLPVSLAVSFLIPLITFTRVKYIEPLQSTTANSFAYLPEATTLPQPQFTFQWVHYLIAIYCFGILVFAVNLLIGHLKAIKIIRFSHLKELFGAQVNLTKKDVHPFSFFRSIVLSEKTLNNPNLEVIVNHEMIHVKERHTLDILFAEILFLLQWFNPFAWLLKAAIRDNLEYLTDDQITKNNNAEAYQLAMVGLAHKEGVAPFLTALNGSQLKNRIIMMKKKTENKYALLKQLIVLPLLAILVMGLSNKEVKTEFVQAKEKVKIVVDGKVIPSDHPTLKSIDFSEGFDGHEVTEALNITDKIISNGFDIKEAPGTSVYYVQTSDYVPGTNPEFEKIASVDIHSEITIKGKISNEIGEPLPGTTVVVKGSTIGTISDLEGNYKIKTNQGNTLVFSMIGYAEKEVAVKGKAQLDVQLKADGSANKDEITIKHAKATSFKVSGKVTSGKGDGIPAVAVVVKGTTIGTISDLEGNYEIKTDDGNTLVFSMIGHESKEVAIDGKSEINVQLKADNSGKPEEIKVIGYGKSKEEPPQIQLLGKTDNPPLYIVDGKETASIENLPPDGIESISILKDESATSVYGAKGKNGVVIITTKEAAKVQVGKALVIVDGKKYEGDVSDINSENIESMQVLKDESATKIYGPAAKDGAIVIKSKSAIGGKEPLIILDGTKFEGNMDDIDPENIESISVLKDATATEKYGDEGKDGVILITTKDAKEIITSELELRKFIAKRIKYPAKARNAGITGTVSVLAKVDKYGQLTLDKNISPEKRIEEVVVVGYKPELIDSPEDEKDAFKALEKEAERVIGLIHSIHIDDVKNKSVAFSIKFDLQ